jgi:hypothetical protein
VFFRHVDDESSDLVLPLLIHGGLWTSIGAAAGLAFGVGLGGRGRIARMLLGGVLGAIAGTMVYDVAGALIFPLAQTGRPLSATWGSRLFAHVAVAFLVAACVAAAAQDPKAKPAPAPRGS